MLQSILTTPNAYVLEKALGASSLRQKVISDNIANVNTPHFKKSEVVFEDVLQKALDGSNKGKLSLVRTNKKHLPIPTTGMGSLDPEINKITTTSMRNDDNNVDIDIEMADMAKNNIYYNAAAQQLGKYFTGLKSVINGGK